MNTNGSTSTTAIARVQSSDFIRYLEIAIERQFKGTERAVLQALIEDGTLNFDQIARQSGYSMYTLRGQTGPRLWEDLTKVFSPAFGSAIGKRNFSAFVQYFSERLASVPDAVLRQGVTRDQFAEVFGIELDRSVATHAGSEIRSVESLYGRTAELNRLTELVQQHRVVALLGSVGIGKTALTARWVEEFGATLFDRVIWKSIVHAPEPDLLLSELLREFKLEDAPTLPQKLSALMQVMKQQRCLIVLDSAEEIISNPAITARNSYSSPDYDRMIRFFGEEPHQSCLMLISRRSFQNVVRMANSNRSAIEMQLSGLPPLDAQKILEAHHLKDSKDWRKLVDHYAGNPGYLIAISEYIQSVFNGSVAQFLRCDTIIFPDAAYREVAEQIQWLGEAYHIVLFHLATHAPIGITQLLVNLSGTIKSQSTVIKAIDELIEMGLVEKKNEHALVFALAPLAKKVILTFPFKHNP